MNPLKKRTGNRIGISLFVCLITTILALEAFALQSQDEMEDRVRKLTPESVRDTLLKAEAGDATSQYILARALYLGQGVARDNAEAAKWYRRAADQGMVLAQLHLSSLYASGEGVTQDKKESEKWLRKAADAGLAIAQFNLGYLVEQARGNYSEAAKWYRRAADQGLNLAQTALGFLYEQGLGVRRDDKEAAKWYRRAADQGDANAQSNLGNLYNEGRGVSKDAKEAARLFRLSAEQGWAMGQANLAGAYIMGQGVSRDLVSAYMWCTLAAQAGVAECRQGLQMLEQEMKPAEIAEAKKRAREWAEAHTGFAKVGGDVYAKTEAMPKEAADEFKKQLTAAEQGDAKAQSVLGEMYYRAGQYEEAVKWVRKSAEQGYSWGQYNLGVAYLEGSGVKQDYTEAIKWFLKAADQRLAEAMNNMAAMYFYGRGVEKDMVMTCMWIILAAEAGDQGAKANLEGLKQRLTESQFKAATQKAAAWRAERENRK